MNKLLAVLFLACISPYALLAQKKVISLHKQAEIVKVDTNDFTIQQFLTLEDTFSFKPLSNETENIDFTDAHFWVRITLSNVEDDSVNYILKTARPITDQVDLYQKSESGILKVLKSGDAQPFSAKSFAHRETVFNLSLAPNTAYVIYMHLKSDGEMITLPLKLYELSVFLADTAKTEFIFGIFYGVLLIAALVYLFFYFSLKQDTFLYYSVYIISFGALQFALDGYMHQYFFANSGWLYSKVVLLTASFSTIFLGLYAQSFLKVNLNFKYLKRVYQTVYVLVSILVVGLMVSSSFLALTYPIINGLALVLIAIIIITIVALWFKKIPVDPFFSLGIFFLVIGLVTFILNNFSLVPSNFITQNSSKIGGILEVIFLSLSMSNLIKKLREEKESSQKISLEKSVEANDLKLYLMSNVSHELRTPLNAIMGLASKIRKEAALKEQEVHDLDVIQHSSKILLGSINNLLDFYKIEKGEMIINSHVFNLRDVLKTISQQWISNIESKNIEHHFELDSALPEFVFGDMDRLVQVIENLFENAIKFTQAGRVSLTTKVLGSAEHSCKILIEIKDTGIGISPEKLEQLFSGFTQAQVDDRRAFGGLGLGLSIAKSVAELQGGKLEITSTLGEGTHCFFTMPFALVPEEEQPQETVLPNQPELPQVNILIVEDNKINQLVIKQMLSTWKNTTNSVAENGEKAIEALKSNHYDLILMDLQMPVMDGYEASQLIRAGEAGEAYINIPIIAVTADTTEQTKLKVREIGMNDYQSKPFTMELLYTKVYKQIKFHKNL